MVRKDGQNSGNSRTSVVAPVMCHASGETLLVLEAVRELSMRAGGSKRLLQASDGRCYIVKFSGLRRPIRHLVTELVVLRLARQLGLSVPRCHPIWVHPMFTRPLDADYRRTSGAVYLAIEAILSNEERNTYPLLMVPRAVLARMTNLGDLEAMRVFGTWLQMTEKPTTLCCLPRGTPDGELVFIGLSSGLNGGTWRLTPGLQKSDVEALSVNELTATRYQSLVPSEIADGFQAVPPEWSGAIPAEDMHSAVTALSRRAIEIGRAGTKLRSL